MGFRRLKITGISKAKKSLLESVLNDFLFSKSQAKEMITDEGLKELISIRWNLGMDCLPEVSSLSKKDWDTHCEKIIAEFRK